MAVWGKSPKFPSGKLLGLCDIPIAHAKVQRVLEKTVTMMDANYDPSPVEISFKANYAAPNVCAEGAGRDSGRDGRKKEKQEGEGKWWKRARGESELRMMLMLLHSTK